MAHTLDTSAVITASTTNPVTKAYTCGAGTTVLVLAFVWKPGTRTGTPTYNGVNLTQADITRQYATSPEAAAELWYLLNPPTGVSYNISIPNAGVVSIWGVVSSYKAQTGYTSVLDTATGGTGITLNPSLAPSAAIAGDVMVEILGDGYASVPTARTHTSLATQDWGQYVAAAQYGLIASSGTVTAGFTIAAEDWGMVVALFKEVSAPPILVISDLLHSQTLDAFNLPQVHNLIVQELLHSQTLDSLNLIQNIVLIIDELLHSQTLENLILAQSYLLVIQELLHSQTLEGLSLSQIHNLTIQELLHSQTTENLILSQLHNLTVQDILHSQTVDSISLIQLFTLVINDILHSQGIDNVTLTLGGITLIISNLLHSQNIDELSLTQIHNLIVQEILHSQVLDNLTLIQNLTLVIQDMIHSQGVLSNIKNYLIFGGEKPWK